MKQRLKEAVDSWCDGLISNGELLNAIAGAIMERELEAAEREDARIVAVNEDDPE